MFFKNKIPPCFFSFLSLLKIINLQNNKILHIELYFGRQHDLKVRLELNGGSRYASGSNLINSKPCELRHCPIIQNGTSFWTSLGSFCVEESWDELWGKTKFAFQFVYDNYIDKVSKPSIEHFSLILTMKFCIKNSVKADLTL